MYSSQSEQYSLILTYIIGFASKKTLPRHKKRKTLADFVPEKGEAAAREGCGFGEELYIRG